MGNHLIPLKVLNTIYKHSSVPIFGTSILFLNNGVVGGYISDPSLLGVAAAQLIAGHSKDLINNGFDYYYDWNLVEKFNFNKTIHENSNILHKNPTFYELYTTEIIIFLSFFVILTFLMILLITSNRKLSRAKVHISSENLRLEDMVSERTQELHSLYDEAAKQSRTDALTGLNNRRAFFEEANQIHSSASQKNQQKYSILMIDIDHFKNINDNYGHKTGDEILKLIAQSIKKELKESAIASRIGGEEFAVILKETLLEDALIIAEKIRKNIFNILYIKEKNIVVKASVSIGVSESINTDNSFEITLSRADNALYKAKEEGRNKVCSS